jgi:hypothetical protein
VLEAVQKRLDENPHAMRTRRETSERPDGLLTKVLPKVATEMALCVFSRSARTRSGGAPGDSFYNLPASY